MDEESLPDGAEYDLDATNAQPKQITIKQIRQELDKAIDEANKECDKLKKENLMLQAEIIELREGKNLIGDKASEFNMSDVKYANTLARVHQIRLELKQTQERYSKMTNDLKIKLNEKIGKCNEIKATFMELKRELSKKAAYSKTDNPIPQAEIDRWEDIEYEKSKTVSYLRIRSLS